MFKNLFSFEGRIRRLEYGLSIIISIVAYFIFFSISLALQNVLVSQILGLPMLVGFFWFSWSQNAKRCHDLGRSGWFQLIPFYGIALLFIDGDQGVNEYGDNPKYPTGRGSLSQVGNDTLDGHMRAN
jgi:uncharacterized membrane protein YhaH (DUF805 family)